MLVPTPQPTKPASRLVRPLDHARFGDARILIVDDEASNIRALTRIVRVAGYSHVVAAQTPDEVLPLYREHDPDLILLDWHLPGRDGAAVLAELRAAVPARSYLPVLVLTGDLSPVVRQTALAAGARDFVTKPFDLDDVLLRIHNLLETRHLYRELTAQNQLLEARVAERTAELEGAQLDCLERLALAAEFRDDETGRHTERVGEAAALLAGRLGLDPEDVFLVRRAAPLHDVGKIGIPDAVLRKPGALSPEEWAVMKQHAVIGARLLAGGRSRIMRLAQAIARSHHERWDGGGYPDGLADEAIPLAARIVAVADVFDALTSDRPYRGAWPADQVLAYITSRAGEQFDPRIAALCGQEEVRRELLAIRSRDGIVTSEMPLPPSADGRLRRGSIARDSI